jgi:hypothetical protein
MASDGKLVVFHLMKEVTSQKPEKCTKVRLFGTEKWSDIVGHAEIRFWHELRTLSVRSKYAPFDEI